MSNSALPPRPLDTYELRHVRVGWWSVLVFLTMGLVLEGMHGLKLGWYLDVDNEARRLVWTLSHTHGTLLGLLHLVWVATLRRWTDADADPVPRWVPIASHSLTAATVLMPGGFFLGGLIVYGGDPGLGVLLVPVGGVFLLLGVGLTTLRLGRKPG